MDAFGIKCLRRPWDGQVRGNADKAPFRDLVLFEADELGDPDVDDDTLIEIGIPKSALSAAREFGPWTADKLRVVELYFMVYRKVAGSGSYIGPFAGEGQASIRGELKPGSPIVAAKSRAFRRLFLCEKKPLLAKRLEAAIRELDQRTANRCVTDCGDANQWVPALLAGGAVPADRPCFAFLDPNSTELHWATVKALATFKRRLPGTKLCKVELLILFNDRQAINRLWETRRGSAESPPRYAHKLDSIFGSREAWWDLWEQGQPSSSLRHRYVDRLHSLGYGHVRAERILDPDSGRVQYHLIHATDHRAAVGFMRWVKGLYAMKRGAVS
jgi:three-Cys-motif partner protein